MGEGDLVRLKLLLPPLRADDDAVRDRARVGHEGLAAHGHGRVRDIAERGLVEPVNEEAGLLELYREEEGSGDVDAVRVNAGLVRAALVDVVLPEGEARLVGEAREEVHVLLLDEEVRVVNRDRHVGARAQPQRLDLRVAVEQVRGQAVAVLRDDPQRRGLLALRQRRRRGEGHDEYCDD